jgi:CobQ-like glutamine amidotransferase family enzyme
MAPGMPPWENAQPPGQGTPPRHAEPPGQGSQPRYASQPIWEAAHRPRRAERGAQPPWEAAQPPGQAGQGAQPPWQSAQPPWQAARPPQDTLPPWEIAQPRQGAQPPWETAQPSGQPGQGVQPPWETAQAPRQPVPGARPPWETAQPPGQTGPAAPASQAGPASYRGMQPSRRGAHERRRPSTLRLVWVYPDLLSTYGDRGNLLILERRARLRGIETESVVVNADHPVPGQGDIYLMGGGEDLPQILAARRLRADGGLAAAAQRGAVVFAVCAGYQLLGAEFGGEEGQPLPGLEILDIRSGRGERRGVGEILADGDPSLGVAQLTGFENHQGVTHVGPGAAPLARVVTGVGNGDGTEGAYAGRVLGTYLHGPVLVRNPALADLLLSWAAGPLPPLMPRDEEWAARLREQRLSAVSPSPS